MAKVNENSKEFPVCPFCDETDIIDKGQSERKPGFYHRWLCNNCDLTFETQKYKNDDFTYLTIGGKYVLHNEFKEWGRNYFTDKIKSEIKSLTAKITRYQILTKDEKYKGILEAVKMIKKI